MTEKWNEALKYDEIWETNHCESWTVLNIVTYKTDMFLIDSLLISAQLWFLNLSFGNNRKVKHSLVDARRMYKSCLPQLHFALEFRFMVVAATAEFNLGKQSLYCSLVGMGSFICWAWVSGWVTLSWSVIFIIGGSDIYFSVSNELQHRSIKSLFLVPKTLLVFKSFTTQHFVPK